MKAYNLYFGDEPARLALRPGRPPREVPGAVRAGWSGSLGPRLGTAWPRSPQTRFPMEHVLTLRLPQEYRRRGPGFPGIAFFAGEGQFADPAPGLDAPPSSDPFLADLARATVNPDERQLVDIIDGAWALVWLTPEQLASGPWEKPADPRRPGERVATDEGANAWDSDEPVVPLWLAERPDPNAGRAPVDHGQDSPDGYEQPWDEDFRPHAWAEQFIDGGFSHLGGTALPVQGMPAGLTPFYLELEEIGGQVNFGGGNAQIDLESGVFDWAC